MEWIIENEYSAKGYKIICGTDEAGRGPLCGNVAAGACILPYGVDIPGLNDSKKLTEKKREKLYDIITSSAIAWAVGEASPEEIDDINILNAAQLAMRRAVAGLSVTPDLVLVDGNVARDFPMDAVAVVKGDSKSPSIAAASILAKVTRDREYRRKISVPRARKAQGIPDKSPLRGAERLHRLRHPLLS